MATQKLQATDTAEWNCVSAKEQFKETKFVEPSNQLDFPSFKCFTPLLKSFYSQMSMKTTVVGERSIIIPANWLWIVGESSNWWGSFGDSCICLLVNVEQLINQ